MLIEEHVSLGNQTYFINSVAQAIVSEQAHFTYYKLQRENDQAIHMAHLFVEQMRDSVTSLTHFSRGGYFARDEVVIKLQGQGAYCQTSGFYSVCRDDQWVDYHIDMNHLAPNSHSEMLYKGILKNKSRAIFNGRLLVEKTAQKTLAYQANHNLLLSNEAEAYSKPQLEIYAEEVKCKHGATIGQINEEALFYLRSRGLNKQQAIEVLLQGFAGEIIQSIPHPGIKSRFQEMMSWN